MTIEEQASGFDVNGPGNPGSLFGLPFTPETAKLVIFPVPWEATVSYRTGTAQGPAAVLKASRQIDFFHREIPEAWKLGVAMLPIPLSIQSESDRLRTLVASYHAAAPEDAEHAAVITDKINEASESLNIYIRKTVDQLLVQGKIIGMLGGDHSTPLGFFRALRDKYTGFGILQVDAHADLRKAYEGFTYSHGSIMYNAMKIPAITRLVQVGIRDFCEEEFQQMQRGHGRVRTFFDEDIRSSLSSGKKTWEVLCKEIVRELPENVFISFDIDGLDPGLCPHTGTPVPGGLDFHQAVTLIKTVAASGRTIIGFDLNEVAPGHDGDWDANVGARILWNLCIWTGVSNGHLKVVPHPSK